MEIISYMRSLDWPKLQVLYGIGYDREVIDETIEMSPVHCASASHLVQTRCLISNTLCRYLVNSKDIWKSTDLITLYTKDGLSRVKAIGIEIDVTPAIDHMFVLIYVGPTAESPSGWYIVQSYINRYSTIIEPIDALQLIRTIRRWRSSGVDPSEWKRYFHADITATDIAVPHTYVIDRLHIDSMPNMVQSIYDRINSLLSSRSSYIYDGRYQCLIDEYL
jgi:hypothetical protein